MQGLQKILLMSMSLLCGGWIQLSGQSIPGYVLPDSIRGPSSNGVAPRYGGYASVNADFHRADFQSLPGAPSCCPHYTAANGTGFSAGAMYERPVTEEWILAGRIGYDRVTGKFRDREATTFIVNGRATPGAFEHRLDVSYQTITLQPMAGYTMFDSLLPRTSIVGYLGLGIGMMIGSNFNQEEAIVDPPGIGVYTESGSDTRNVYSGSIQGMATAMLDIRAGIGGDIRLNNTGTILLSPEIWYSYNLTRAVSSVAWHADALRFGIAFKYRPDFFPAHP